MFSVMCISYSCSFLFQMSVVEALHTIGLCCLVYKVLPELDMIRALFLMSCMGVLPGILKMVFSVCPKYDRVLAPPEQQNFNKNETIEHPKNKVICIVWRLGNSFSIVVQVGTIIYVMIRKSDDLIHLSGDKFSSTENTLSDIYFIPIGLLLVSVRYWENFVDRDINLGPVR